MTIPEKRKLLEAVDKFVKRPGDVNEETLGDALRGFKKLIESSTGGVIEVHYVVNREASNEQSND